MWKVKDQYFILNCLTSRKDGDHQIMTPFVDTDTGNDLDPHEIIGKHMKVQAVVKIESIFIGNKISLQVKVVEVLSELVGQKRVRRLIPRVKKDSVVYDDITPVEDDVSNLSLNKKKESDKEESEESDKEDSDNDKEDSEDNSDISESEEEKVPEKPVKKKVVRKRVVKK